MATAPATKRLPNIKGWVYDDDDSYCRVEDEESREMVTDAYDPAATYKKSETCIQDNKLYRAKADITTAEIWTPDHWEETSLEAIRAEMAAEISKANSDISALNANKSSIKVDTLEIITDQYSNIDLYNHGYNAENTLAAYVIGGITEVNIVAKLYTYNGLLVASISVPGTGTTYPNTRVKLRVLHI